MEIAANTPVADRTIAGFSVKVPQPYAAGQPLTEATAAMLNQTFAENISNNMRKKLEAGFVPADAPEGAEAQAYDDASAQAAIDQYVSEYEPGVRRGGGGEARVTDPVEREARKIAREKAKQVVKANGLKPADVDMGELTDKIFDSNRDLLMAEGKKIVKAQEAAKAKGDGLDLSGLNLGGGAE